MLSGFYTAASGMLVQQQTLNVLSNNIANVKTPGAKVERVVSTTFKDVLVKRQEAGQSKVIGSGSSMRIIEEVPSVFDPSALEETGRPFDIAINGQGYFNIQGDNQQFLTRNGQFNIDEEGFLVLSGAGRVMGERGEIEIKSSYFTVSSDGTVYDDRNKRIDKLLITQPAEGTKLNKFSNGLFTAPNEEANVKTVNPTLLQGTIERSNIDLNREYTMVMETQRTFQSCSAAVKIVDELNQKTVTQIASL